MVNFSKRKIRAEAPRFFEPFADGEGTAFGNYAWSLIDRGLIARWKTGVEADGEAWAELLDAEDRVIWRVVRSGNWFMLIDDQGEVRSASRRLRETLSALP